MAKRYIDDYKKMQADPKYGDEVRMDPGAYKPKVDRKGKPKEAEQFEQWADNIEKSALEIPAEEPKAEGNEFAQAVQKAKAAGMKAGDKFKVGDKAFKPNGYKFPCTIVSVFETKAGEVRIVGEMDDNMMLHIFNEKQLEHK